MLLQILLKFLLKIIKLLILMLIKLLILMLNMWNHVVWSMRSYLPKHVPTFFTITGIGVVCLFCFLNQLRPFIWRLTLSLSTEKDV